MEESIPLFSVLIANYNNGRYLEDAINSVFQQTYPHWEVVIVDDGSTDQSMTIYQKYADDNRIHIYYNDRNHGCGYTKRRCAEQAHGDLCGFLDPDDTLAPQALEVMVNIHKEHPSLSLAYSRFTYKDNDLTPIPNPDPYIACPIAKDSSFLEGGGIITHFAAFKKSAYDKTPGINSLFLRAVDNDMYYKLEEVGEVMFIDQALYNYRINTGQNISLGDNGFTAHLWDLLAMVDACQRRGIPVEDLAFKRFERWFHSMAAHEAYDILHRSHDYLIGYLVLWPIRKIRGFIAKMK